jgi:hypothetical protein
MWVMLMLLWIIPLGLGLLALGGEPATPALKDRDAATHFDQGHERNFGIWPALTFAVLAVLFFVVGIVEGVLLPNLGSFWLITVPFLTGGGAFLTVFAWWRYTPRQSRALQKRISRVHLRAARLADTLFR